MKKISRKKISTPQEALDHAMNTLKRPYNVGDRELVVLSKDPSLCLSYIQFVLLPDYGIPDIILESIIRDQDIYDIFKSLIPKTIKKYKNISKIINKPI